MQIKKMGVEITDVPGVEWIRIEPNERSEGGVRVAVKIFSSEPSLGFGIRELGQLIEALVTAEGEAELIANPAEEPPTGKGPWTWDRLEDVPPYVTRVRDREGECWNREPDHWAMVDGTRSGPASNQYAPFRATK